MLDLVEQGRLDAGCNLGHVAMGAAERFGDDVIDDAELLEPIRRHAHGFRGVRGELGRFPQDRRAAFRRDHGVGGILQHVELIGDADGDRAAGIRLAGHRCNQRRAYARHHRHVFGDRLVDAAFFRIHARIGARRVDETDHGQPIAFGQFHEPPRLAITFRPRHAEVVLDLGARAAAFLMADDHYRTAADLREPADDRLVVGVKAVAVQLVEIGHDVIDVVERIGTQGMARNLADLPGRQVGINLFCQAQAFLPQRLDFLVDIEFVVAADKAQFADLVFKFSDRLFKFQKIGIHSR